MLQLDNVTTSDNYGDCEIASESASHVVYLIANNAVRMQVRGLYDLSIGNSPDWSPPEGMLVAPTTAVIDKCSGIRFKSAVSGKAAQIIAQLMEPKDVLPQSGTPFTQQLTPGGGLQGLVGVQVGMIAAYGAATDPVGWLICDGRAISRTTYQALFSIIGITYGSGDGSTTFNIPDLQGRFPVGLGSHVDINAVGKNDGVALANRRPAHKHSGTFTGSAGTTGVDSPDHAHGTSMNQVITALASSTNGVISPVAPPGLFTGGASARHAHGFTPIGSVTIGPQTGAEPLDTVPYETVTYCIATGV